MYPIHYLYLTTEGKLDLIRCKTTSYGCFLIQLTILIDDFSVERDHVLSFSVECPVVDNICFRMCINLKLYIYPKHGLW